MARPTNAERVLKKKLEAESLERLRRGTVTVLVWKGKVFCSSRCILRYNGWDYLRTGLWGVERELLDDFARETMPDPPEEFEEYVTSEPSPLWFVYLRRRDRQYFKLVRRGHWPLKKYELRKHYAVDVEHFKCARCFGSMRKKLTPQKAKAKDKLRKERASAKRAAKAKKPDLWSKAITPEERRYNRDAQRKRRAWVKLTIAEKAAAMRAQNAEDARRARTFQEDRQHWEDFERALGRGDPEAVLQLHDCRNWEEYYRRATE